MIRWLAVLLLFGMVQPLATAEDTAPIDESPATLNRPEGSPAKGTETIPQDFRNKAARGVASEFESDGEVVAAATSFDFDNKKIVVIWFDHYYGSYDKVVYRHHFSPRCYEYTMDRWEFTGDNAMSMKGSDFVAHLTSDLQFELIDRQKGIKIKNISAEGRKVQDTFFPNIDLAYPH